jgi:hypothetical protein
MARNAASNRVIVLLIRGASDTGPATEILLFSR